MQFTNTAYTQLPPHIVDWVKTITDKERALFNRYLGTLVGVHAGDSIGAPYETWKPQQIDKDIKARGGLTFFDYDNPWGESPGDRNGLTLPAGRPTDDSDQTADLCHSLIACGRVDADHLRDSLINSVGRGVSRLWDGQATGSGRTTRNALGVGAKTKRINGVPSNTIGTNGSLMRCAPMALHFGPNIDLQNPMMGFNHYLYEIQTMSKVTHDHPHSVTACEAYTEILCYVLAGKTPQTAINKCTVKGIMSWTKQRLKDPFSFPYDPGAWPARGIAEFSLYAALYAFLKSDSFAEGIEIAVRVGGDTDTYGAIAGGLLGAHYGYEAIPQEWREAILGHDVMAEYAMELFTMRLYK